MDQDPLWQLWTLMLPTMPAWVPLGCLALVLGLGWLLGVAFWLEIQQERRRR